MISAIASALRLFATSAISAVFAFSAKSAFAASQRHVSALTLHCSRSKHRKLEEVWEALNWAAVVINDNGGGFLFSLSVTFLYNELKSAEGDTVCHV
jgi:hypothetical protein